MSLVRRVLVYDASDYLAELGGDSSLRLLAQQKAEVEMRTAALRHAFKAETANWEWNGKKWIEISQWIFVVECDAHGTEVIKALSDYPVVGELAKVSGERSFVEPSSGKSVAFLAR